MPNAAPLVSTGVQLRDDNDSPISGFGLILSNSKNLTASNAAGTAVPIFHITGSVQVLGLWGVVTTALGVACTATYWRLNDQTTQSNITLNTGTDISAASKGAIIVKKGLAAAALTLLDSTQERVSEPTTLETMYFSQCVLVQKTGGITTDIEFLYSTTDTPTTGTINFYVQYFPLGAGSKITVA